MFKNLLLKLLLLGLVLSIAFADDKAEEKHEDKKDDHHEDEHDEEHEKITPNHDDKKDDDHHDDEDHHDDDHDDKKDDDHEDDHDDKKDDHDDDHDDKKDDHEDDHEDDKKDDDDEGDHDDAKDDDDEDDTEDGGHPEHDAFLGDQLTAFQDLQDEEAKKKKLQDLVVNHVDTNKDGFVTEDEIRQRLLFTTKEQRRHEMNNTMITHDDNKDGKVSWEEFKKHHFTHEKGDDVAGDKEQMEDDEAKFKHADVDGDGGLNLDEYISFYHPGDDERMSAFVIGRTLQKYDADKDGALSQEEYTKSYKDLNDEAKTEIAKDYTNTYDSNKDGKLEVNELKKWLFPDEDMTRDEPPAMMKEADDNKDGKLSMEEILKNYKVFVDDPPLGDANGEHDEL